MTVILSRFAGKGMFCLWDADRGFNQITATVRAAHRAAFEHLEELWMSWRMSFGTTNAPATFARNMVPTIKDVKTELKGKVPDQDVDNYYDDCIQSGPAEDWLGCLKATDIFLNKAFPSDICPKLSHGLDGRFLGDCR